MVTLQSVIKCKKSSQHYKIRNRKFLFKKLAYEVYICIYIQLKEVIFAVMFGPYKS